VRIADLLDDGSWVDARIDHAIALSHVQRHRLFTQYVFASFCSGDCLFGVQMNRSSDVDGIDFIIH